MTPVPARSAPWLCDVTDPGPGPAVSRTYRGLLPGRAEALLALVDRLPEGGEDDPIAQFRKASALRALGQYHQARTAVERALELLPPGNLAVHADLVREHTLITAAYDLTQLPYRRRKPNSP